MNKFGRITTGGVITEFPLLSANANPSRFLAGPDGALWVLERGANKIARVTTDGIITNEFPIPTANSDTRDMTLGPMARYGSPRLSGTRSAE